MTDGELDLLEKKYKAATGGKWQTSRRDDGRVYAGIHQRRGGAIEFKDGGGEVAECDDFASDFAEGQNVRNAEAIVAMRNALPALIADSRALAAYRTREQQARELVGAIRALDAETDSGDYHDPDGALHTFRRKVSAIVGDLEAIYAKEAAS